MGVAAMKEPSAFRAVYADWRLVKTRQAIQIVFEIPLSDADAAYDVLGGMPQPAAERWFGIAAIKSGQMQAASPKAVKVPIDWRELPAATQAAIRSDDVIFQAFLREEYDRADITSNESAAEFIRCFAGMKSRSELSTDHRKRVLWHQLDSQFSAWLANERTGA